MQFILSVLINQNTKQFMINQHNSDRRRFATVGYILGRVKSLYNKRLANGGNTKFDGFKKAVIDSNFEGWHMETVTNTLSIAETSDTFSKLAFKFRKLGYKSAWYSWGVDTSVFTPIALTKGQANKEFNVANLTKTRIDQKIKKVIDCLNCEVPRNVSNSAYLAAVGIKYAPYNVNTLGNLQRFIIEQLEAEGLNVVVA